jgi:endonuclease-3
MMRRRSDINISKLIETLRELAVRYVQPMSFSIIDKFGKDPFLILVSCLLSLRTKDTVTLPVSLKLFKQIRTPQDIIDTPLEELEALIYPVGFYRKKALQLKQISSILIVQYNSSVPPLEESLLALPGVGIKTANLVLGLAFDVPAICVDIHVHRISNKLELVNTKTPEETEKALKEVLPEKYWIEWNYLLVVWGQNTCRKVDPICDFCLIGPICPVKKVSCI